MSAQDNETRRQYADRVEQRRAMRAQGYQPVVYDPPPRIPASFSESFGLGYLITECIRSLFGR